MEFLLVFLFLPCPRSTTTKNDSPHCDLHASLQTINTALLGAATNNPSLWVTFQEGTQQEADGTLKLVTLGMFNTGTLANPCHSWV